MDERLAVFAGIRWSCRPSNVIDGYLIGYDDTSRETAIYRCGNQHFRVARTERTYWGPADPSCEQVTRTRIDSRNRYVTPQSSVLTITVRGATPGPCVTQDVRPRPGRPDPGLTVWARPAMRIIREATRSEVERARRESFIWGRQINCR